MAAPILLCDCEGMPRDRWLECRDHGPKGDIEYTVGGSDVSTIFGVNPWVTPLELWMQKKGRMKRSDPKNQNQMVCSVNVSLVLARIMNVTAVSTRR